VAKTSLPAKSVGIALVAAIAAPATRRHGRDFVPMAQVAF